MSLVNDIKDVKHVAHYAVRFFMNEDNLGHSVGCLGLLKRKESIVIIAFLVLGAERLNPLGFKIIGRKIFTVTPPVSETMYDLIVMLNRLDRIIRGRILHHQESRRIRDVSAIGVDAKGLCQEQLAMLIDDLRMSIVNSGGISSCFIRCRHGLGGTSLKDGNARLERRDRSASAVNDWRADRIQKRG